jgi:hypothetical protein
LKPPSFLISLLCCPPFILSCLLRSSLCFFLDGVVEAFKFLSPPFTPDQLLAIEFAHGPLVQHLRAKLQLSFHPIWLIS